MHVCRGSHTCAPLCAGLIQACRARVPGQSARSQLQRQVRVRHHLKVRRPFRICLKRRGTRMPRADTHESHACRHVTHRRLPCLYYLSSASPQPGRVGTIGAALHRRQALPEGVHRRECTNSPLIPCNAARSSSPSRLPSRSGEGSGRERRGRCNQDSPPALDGVCKLKCKYNM